jgi:hypothetical protein
MALTMSMAGFGSFSARAVVDLRVLPVVASTAGRAVHPASLSGVSAGLLGALGEVFLQGRPGGFALVGLGADGFQQPLRGRADADQLVIADGLTADDRALQLFGAERQAGRLADQVALKLADVAAELTRHNNPNRGRADLQRARSTLDVIVSDLRQRGIIPTAKQRLDQALNKAFPNAQSPEEVEYEGKRYRRRFVRAEYGWTRGWEDVQ